MLLLLFDEQQQQNDDDDDDDGKKKSRKRTLLVLCWGRRRRFGDDFFETSKRREEEEEEEWRTAATAAGNAKSSSSSAVSKETTLNEGDFSGSAERIRNFPSLNIDHGKSTIAITPEITIFITRETCANNADGMDLKRERGLRPAELGQNELQEQKTEKCNVLNLIDTPGHVDFSYDVEVLGGGRSFRHVDASQGVK